MIKIDKTFFKKHQKELLWLANNWFTKWLLGLNKIPKPIKYNKIKKITPNSIHWKIGKVLKTKRGWEEQWKSAHFTKSRFSIVLARNLSSIFQLLFGLMGGQILVAGTTTNYDNGGGDDAWVETNDQTSWDGAHDDNVGTVRGKTYVIAASGYKEGPVPGASDDYYFIWRAFIPFDTSGLPDNAEISAASVNLVPYDKRDDFADDNYDYIQIVGETYQNDVTEIFEGDFDTCADTDNPGIGSAEVDVDDLTLDTNNVIALNATGLGWINKTGYTMLGIRQGYDIEDVSPGVVSGEKYCWVIFRNSSTGGSEPYLSITYTTFIPKIITH